MSALQNNPFNYPRSKHRRTQSPEYSKDYKKYKKSLQVEYGRKCIFCMMPDTIKGYDFFSVEHYRPKSKFPDLEVEYKNLFYCCMTCNRRKGNKWIEESEIFIPNPDDHVMFEHLRYAKEIVHSHSIAGEYTSSLLQLNEPSIQRFRKAILTSLEALENKVDELIKLKAAIIKDFNKGGTSKEELDEFLLDIDNQNLEYQQAIDVIAGR